MRLSARRRHSVPMHASDPPLPRVFSNADARAAGLSDRQIERRLAGGAWRPLRRGVFELSSHRACDDDRVEAGLLAAVRSVRRHVVVSHLHAARMWGLPRPLTGWGEPVLTACDGPTRYRDGVRVVVAPLSDDEVVGLGGALAVTSAARTVADCARTLPAHEALAIADTAVQRLLPLRDLGRGDAWWGAGVVGEGDGRAKYRLAAAERGGIDARRLAQVLDDEREREMALRRAGARVVRWGPRDVLDPQRSTALADHLRRELTSAAGERAFTGGAAQRRIMLRRTPVARPPGVD
jgi:hypothetical protein